VDPDLLSSLKTFTDAGRLRILGRLAAHPGRVEELAAELGMPLGVVVRQVGLLRRAGLVGPGPGGEGVMLRLDTLQSIGRRLDELEARTPGPSFAIGADGKPLPADEAKVLRSYLEDGRLTTIPASTRKRMVVLRWLLDQVFAEDRDYPEKEVNQRLALFHPDVASLRRYMVDAGMVRRERGIYRRPAGEG
jgi:hypothetical protein